MDKWNALISFCIREDYQSQYRDADQTIDIRYESERLNYACQVIDLNFDLVREVLGPFWSSDATYKDTMEHTCRGVRKQLEIHHGISDDDIASDDTASDIDIPGNDAANNDHIITDATSDDLSNKVSVVACLLVRSLGMAIIENPHILRPDLAALVQEARKDIDREPLQDLDIEHLQDPIMLILSTMGYWHWCIISQVCQLLLN